jgi:hypothetical protein
MGDDRQDLVVREGEVSVNGVDFLALRDVAIPGLRRKRDEVGRPGRSSRDEKDHGDEETSS